MNKEDLFNELGNIDTKFIQEADNSSKPKYIAWKRYTAIAAIFVLAVSVINNYDYVQAAIKKMFSFIPGVSITEEEKSSILYSMDGLSQTKSNGAITFTVNNAYVTNDSVDIAWEISIDFIDETNLNKNSSSEDIDKIIAENNASQYLKADPERAPFINTTINVTIDGQSFPVSMMSGGGSVSQQTCVSRVENVSDIISKYGVDTPITVSIGDLSYDINLKPIEYYDSIDQIGPTIFKNDISFTAIPEWSDNQLNIKMYSLNYSDFTQVYGYDDSFNESTRPYIIIGSNKIICDPISGDGTEFNFNLDGYSLNEQDKESAELHIPSVAMLNYEESSFDIKINSDNTIEFPDTVHFKYSDINIQSMKIGTQEWPDCIEMVYKTDNMIENINLSTFSIASVNGKGPGGMATYFSLADEKGISKIAFKFEDIPVEKYKNITISSPNYLLTDELVFQLN